MTHPLVSTVELSLRQNHRNWPTSINHRRRPQFPVAIIDMTLIYVAAFAFFAARAASMVDRVAEAHILPASISMHVILDWAGIENEGT